MSEGNLYVVRKGVHWLGSWNAYGPLTIEWVTELANACHWTSLKRARSAARATGGDVYALVPAAVAS